MLRAKFKVLKVSLTKIQRQKRDMQGQFCEAVEVVPMTELTLGPVFHPNPEHENAKFWLSVPQANIVIGCTTGEFDGVKPDDDMYFQIELAPEIAEPLVVLGTVVPPAGKPKLRGVTGGKGLTN